MKQIFLLLAVGTSTVALLGCSTPQPVLDQARTTGALTAVLQNEVEEYRRTQALIAEQRIENVRVQLAMVARNDMRATYADQLDEAIGNSETRRFYKQLLVLVAARAEEERAHEAKLKGIDDRLSKLRAPLPETTSKLGAAQKALIPLSEEMSSSERISALASFAKAVKKGIDETKKQIENAQNATPQAPVQAPE